MGFHQTAERDFCVIYSLASSQNQNLLSDLVTEMRVAIGRASEAIERKQWIFCRGSANPRYEKAMSLYRIRVSGFCTTQLGIDFDSYFSCKIQDSSKTLCILPP